jgi:hypothetical protein
MGFYFTAVFRNLPRPPYRVPLKVLSLRAPGGSRINECNATA